MKEGIFGTMDLLWCMEGATKNKVGKGNQEDFCNALVEATDFETTVKK